MKDNFLIQDDMKIMKKKASGVGYGSLGIYWTQDFIGK
jgi:hypothetical protein